MPFDLNEPLKSTLENVKMRVQRDCVDMWTLVNHVVNHKCVSELC